MKVEVRTRALTFFLAAVLLGFGIYVYRRAGRGLLSPKSRHIDVSWMGDDFKRRTGKVFFLGIDGATFDVMQPLLDKGELPNFSRLINSGAKARLKTINPTDSPLIWTTLVTGVMPEVHGIQGFQYALPATRETTLVSSDLRRVPAIWNILSEVGYTVGIVNWWASYPAEKVNGFIVSDRANSYAKTQYRESLSLTARDMRERTRHETCPPELSDEIQPLLSYRTRIDEKLVRAVVDLPPELMRELQNLPSKEDGSLLAEIKFGLLEDRAVTDAALACLMKNKPDFLAVYLLGVDGIEHHFWHLMEPARFDPRPDGADVRYFRNVIPAYYKYVDSLLGEFLKAYEAMGERDLAIVVVSDHGQSAVGGSGRRPKPFVSGHHAQAPDGILILSGSAFTRKAVLKKPHVLDITPTLLTLMNIPKSAGMPGRVLSEAFIDGPGPVEARRGNP